MSDGKLFIKTKSSEIKAELDQAYKKSKPHGKIKIILKKVTANIIINNNEISRLLPDMINLLRFDDIEIRRVCLDYLSLYSHYDPTVAVKSLPFLRRFREDNDAVLRALTIKTIASIGLPEFVDLSFQVIRLYLKDKNSFVRISASFALARMFHNDSTRVLNEGLLTDLNELLYDDDQGVVSVALSALDSIIEFDKSLDLKLTVNPDHFIQLVKHIHKSTEWSQIYVINSLLSFVPTTTESALDMIELILPFLQHENSAIVLNAVKVIVYLSNYVNNPQLIIPTLPKRLGSSLVSLLAKPTEIQFLVLRNIILLLLGRKELVEFNVEMLFCKYDDAIYVKDTKLEIIYLLANEENFSIVARELEEYATDVDVAMARKAIRAFGNLAVKLHNAAPLCVEIIMDIISNGVSYIVQESAVVLRNIVRRYPGQFDDSIIELVKHYKVIDESDSKTAMIWILGQYCGQFDSWDILKDISKSYRDESLEVQLAILTATIKMYLNYPTEYETTTLEVLKWATEEVDNPDLRERGFFYWRLISSENNEFQKVAKDVVLVDNPIINSENENINPQVLEELELNIGTLASIYLKPVSQVFRLSRHKKLTPSPALQSRKKKTTVVEETPVYSNRKATLSTDQIHRKKSIMRQASFDSSFSGISDDSQGSNKITGLANRLSRRASMITGKKKF
ncbi:AP-2 complex subunit beta [[Candida] jaroonii]|uniref:AP-2 complex subunit beta n=1 Tax=[Candida] jaroonii TaxID=467808 RepID=A0ACA9Y623_9ASCO|nr:AP-2 complex subunit beta [[Candida] jaroonii]